MSARPVRPRTVVARAGVCSDTQHGAVMAPLHVSSTFTFEALGTPRRYDYTRSGNPTRDLLGDALTELEGGCGSVITSSGMAAVTVALQLVPPGGRVVAPTDGYGGTHRLLEAFARRGAIHLDLVDVWDLSALGTGLRGRADLLWIESPSNPLLRVSDIAAAAEMGHAAGAIVVVDNTFLSPALQRPLSLGADLVVHSTTKYLNGHSDVVGGALVAGAPGLLEESAWWANALGVTGSPYDAHLTLRGMRTLHVRMSAHLEGAAALASLLVGHPAVRAVHWPGLPEHPEAALAARQQDGPGAMLSFELEGGLDAVRRFVDGLHYVSLAESLGGVETLLAHPATMTHAALTEAQRRRAGIGEGLLRLSVGIEDPADLTADVARALQRAAAPLPV